MEEGSHTAKGLDLVYDQCRYAFAMGRLETVLVEGQMPRAESMFRQAARLAEDMGYRELLWQIQFRLGECLAEGDNRLEAGSYLRDAVGGLKQLVVQLPEGYRELYSDVTSVSRLWVLVSELSPSSGEAHVAAR